MNALLAGLRQLRHYPSAIIGLTIVLGLLVLSLVTVLTIPYREAIRLWRGGAGVWDENPELARPAWFQLFSSRKPAKDHHHRHAPRRERNRRPARWHAPR